MNFLFLNSARDWGGNEKWTHMAAHTLAANHAVYLAYRRDVVGERFEVERIKLPFISGSDVVTLGRLIRFIRQHQIDVLIPTKRKDYVLAGLASRLLSNYPGAQRRIKNVLRLGIVRPLHKRPDHNLVYNHLADGVIVNAKPIRDVLLESPFMQAERIRLIYNGLDTTRLLDSLNSSEERPFPFTITTMGRLTARKGFDRVLTAFAELIRQNNPPDAGLVVIGDGEKCSALQKMAHDLDIANQVRFTGFMDNPYPLLHHSDVFVLASRNEGIPNALLEAMFLRNAVITTPAGGVAETITHLENGLLTAAEQPQLAKSLGEQLSWLYQNHDARRKLADAAHQTVITQFSLDRMRHDIQTFCSEI